MAALTSQHPIPAVPGIEDPALGTTIMAFKFDGGVILAADSRTSSGSYVANRVSDKVTKLSDKIYVCRSGSAADTQAMADYATMYLNMQSIDMGESPRVSTAASLLQALCYSNRNYLMAGLICAGYDDTDGPSVYNIPLVWFV
mmetsp:Transcript_29944/g.77295  ORF Transcript_29944/g.77295 Transcript_29944/m.77295 type:complete len:143 (+) Transcript_29944:297-725(+)